MSNMSALSQDIVELLEEGLECEAIAKQLGCPLAWVLDIAEANKDWEAPNDEENHLREVENGLELYDAQYEEDYLDRILEAQEWHDFDPAC